MFMGSCKKNLKGETSKYALWFMFENALAIGIVCAMHPLPWNVIMQNWSARNQPVKLPISRWLVLSPVQVLY